MFKLNIFRNLNVAHLPKFFTSTLESQVVPRVPHTNCELYESLMMLRPNSPENSKTLKISVLGCPNSGKSTLVNMLTRWKVCAVSGKINTTRTKQTVILTQDNIQLCFIDMPGVIGRKKGFNFKLEKSLIRDPHVGIFESDLVICVVDVTHKGSHEELNRELLKALHFFRDKPSILVLNKIDRLDKKMVLLDITKKLTDGVVGGRISHKDRYANRYRRTVPSYGELLEDGRLSQLLLRQTAPARIAGSSEDVAPDRLELGNTIATEAVTEAATEDLEGGTDHPASSSSSSSSSWSLSPSSRQTEAEEEMREIMRLIGGGDADIDRQHLEIDDQIMGVLKANLAMLRGGTGKQEVADRRTRWREVSSHLDRTKETSWRGFTDVFAVSSATGHGIDRLREYLMAKAVAAPWPFHSSLITDQDPHTFVRMSVWAACLSALHQEVPYQLDIDIASYEKSTDGSIHILVNINCRRSRHLLSVIGTKGANIKWIADSARAVLETGFKADVYLKVVAKRSTVPGEHLKRMRSVDDVRKLYPQSQ